MCARNVRTGKRMSGVRRSLGAVVALGAIWALTLTACKGGDNKAAAPWLTSAPSAPAASAPTESGAAGGTTTAPIKLSPANGHKNVPISAEIGVKVSGGKVATVALKDAKGHSVAGALREDGS